MDGTMRLGKWWCELCGIFASCERNLNQHLTGAKHKENLSMQQSSRGVSQGLKSVTKLPVKKKRDLKNDPGETMREEGGAKRLKHEQKLPSKKKREIKDDPGETINEESVTKSNGGTVRPLPEDFDSPQPDKMTKFSCSNCNIIIKSPTQLQQRVKKCLPEDIAQTEGDWRIEKVLISAAPSKRTKLSSPSLQQQKKSCNCQSIGREETKDLRDVAQQTKCEDEHGVFLKHIEVQLRGLPLTGFIVLQEQIQSLLTRERMRATTHESNAI